MTICADELRRKNTKQNNSIIYLQVQLYIWTDYIRIFFSQGDKQRKWCDLLKKICETILWENIYFTGIYLHFSAWNSNLSNKPRTAWNRNAEKYKLQLLRFQWQLFCLSMFKEHDLFRCSRSSLIKDVFFLLIEINLYDRDNVHLIMWKVTTIGTQWLVKKIDVSHRSIIHHRCPVQL